MFTNWINVTAPGALPLALARFEREGSSTPVLIGAALKHALTDLSVGETRGLTVTGGRAPLAQGFAERFYEHHGLAPGAEIEVEWAIAAGLGLGSEAILGLSVARALAAQHQLAARDTYALAKAIALPLHNSLEIAAFDGGGILAVDFGEPEAALEPPIARQTFAQKNSEAWAFALFEPLAPEGTPRTLEADRKSALAGAVDYLSPQSAHILADELLPALQSDDIAGFGKALMSLQAMTLEALAQAGAAPSFSEQEQSILDTLRDNGAYAWGQSLTGLTFYGLVKGNRAAAEMKKKLLALMGHHNGTTMSSAIDNQGARHEWKLHEKVHEVRVGRPEAD